MTFESAKEQMQTQLDTFSDREIEGGITIRVEYIDATNDRIVLCINTDGKSPLEVIDAIDRATRPLDLCDHL